jgi:hypothetical protein
MKHTKSKLQYIVGKRNGRFYKIFLSDIKAIKSCGKKNRPKVPAFNEEKEHKVESPMELEFLPFDIASC